MVHVTDLRGRSEVQCFCLSLDLGCKMMRNIFRHNHLLIPFWLECSCGSVPFSYSIKGVLLMIASTARQIRSSMLILALYIDCYTFHIQGKRHFQLSHYTSLKVKGEIKHLTVKKCLLSILCILQISSSDDFLMKKM